MARQGRAPATHDRCKDGMAVVGVVPEPHDVLDARHDVHLHDAGDVVAGEPISLMTARVAEPQAGCLEQGFHRLFLCLSH